MFTILIILILKAYADSDKGNTDTYGYGCHNYIDEKRCENYDDDDVDSIAMCCSCGGGIGNIILIHYIYML